MLDRGVWKGQIKEAQPFVLHKHCTYLRPFCSNSKLKGFITKINVLFSITTCLSLLTFYNSLNLKTESIYFSPNPSIKNILISMHLKESVVKLNWINLLYHCLNIFLNRRKTSSIPYLQNKLSGCKIVSNGVVYVLIFHFILSYILNNPFHMKLITVSSNSRYSILIVL